MRSVLLLGVLAAGCAAGGPPAEPLYDGKPLEHWVRELHDLKEERVEVAASVLPSFGEAALPVFEEALRRDRPYVRLQVARSMNRWATGRRPPPAGLVPLLLRCLGDDEIHVRWNAVDGLADMRPTPPEAEPALERMLEDPAEEVRSAARMGLEGIRGARENQGR